MAKFWFIFPLILCACSAEPEPEKEDFDWTNTNSTDLSRSVAAQEEIDIKLFLERHKDWKVKRTGSGLQYYLYKEGSADTNWHPIGGDVADIEYVITLLSGDTCYFTASDEYERFVVDNSEIESGLQEGIKLMSPGDRAHLIVPSHLAHGMAGDLDKIPPLTTLVIDIHLMGIRKK